MYKVVSVNISNGFIAGKKITKEERYNQVKENTDNLILDLGISRKEALLYHRVYDRKGVNIFLEKNQNLKKCVEEISQKEFIDIFTEVGRKAYIYEMKCKGIKLKEGPYEVFESVRKREEAESEKRDRELGFDPDLLDEDILIFSMEV